MNHVKSCTVLYVEVTLVWSAVAVHLAASFERVTKATVLFIRTEYFSNEAQVKEEAKKCEAVPQVSTNRNHRNFSLKKAVGFMITLCSDTTIMLIVNLY